MPNVSLLIVPGMLHNACFVKPYIGEYVFTQLTLTITVLLVLQAAAFDAARNVDHETKSSEEYCQAALLLYSGTSKPYAHRKVANWQSAFH